MRTRAPSYVLDLPPGAVDADRFRALVTAPAELDRLDAALALWRGPAYAEFPDLARAEAARLEALRHDAEDARLELLARLGRRADAIATAAGLVAAAPGRDRAVRVLAAGLAAAGRAPAALDAIRVHREWLADELGLDPSPELEALHTAILRGGGGVAVAAGVEAVDAERLIGRDPEVAAVATTLRTAALVTIVGPGGVGKTWLARACRPAWWADLAAVTAAEAVAPAVAAAVGVDVDGGDLAGALRGWADGAEGLLVLDNCEHLLQPVQDLLCTLSTVDTAARRLRVLATSRERIGAAGERVFVLEPLPAAAAEELFRVRAAAADPSFTGSPLVGTVCAALDHLPLAIELAAARIGALTVDDLAARIAGNADGRLSLLTTGPRGRHQTLRAVIDWSYELLRAPERLAFARLHVFAAGFDLTAAEAVIGYGRLDPPDVAHVVALLAQRSLLVRRGATGPGRYRMLESLRVYAATLLGPAELDERLPAGTAAQAVALANLALPMVYGAATATTAAARTERAGTATAGGVRAGTAGTAAEWAEVAVVAARRVGQPSAVAFALFARAEAAGDERPEAAFADLAEAIRIADEVGGRFVAGIARSALVALRGRHGAPGVALELFAEVLAHWRVTGGRPLLAVTLRNLVVLLARTGRDTAAAELGGALAAASNRGYGADARRVERALAAVRDRMAAEDFAAAWARGTGRDMETAAAAAAAVLNPAAP